MNPIRIRRRQLPLKTRFFLKSFLVNVLLLLLPISLLASFSIWKLNEESRQNIQKNNWNLLYQLDAHMNFLFQQIDNISLYYAQSPSVRSQLRQALRETSLSPDDIRVLNTFSVYLQNLVCTNSTIESVYVYYDNDNGRFLSSDTKGLANLRYTYDTGWVDSYQTSDEDMWYEARQIQKAHFSPAHEVISLYQKIYSPLVKDRCVGVIVTQFRADALRSYLDSLQLSPNQTIAFLDEDGSIILKNQAIDIPDSLRALFAEDSALMTANLSPVYIGKTRYIASLKPSSRSGGWTCLSLIPESELYESSARIQKTAVIFILFVILMSSGIAFSKANRDYRRLEQILLLLEHPETFSEHTQKPERDSDLYGYITQNLIQMFLQNNYLKVQVSEKKYHMQVLEMRALQQQINPHFLYNTLHTIYWEALRMTQGPNLCSKMVANLSDIMEYALGDSQESVKLKEELDYLRAYLEIQSVRYGNKFQIDWDIDDRAVIYRIRKMILQPLVENAIYHGIKERMEAHGIIRIKAYLREDHLFISVTDNGVGMNTQELSDLRSRLKNTDSAEQHIGLCNTHRRLLLAYGKSCGLHVASRPQRGTVVWFRLPIPH